MGEYESGKETYRKFRHTSYYYTVKNEMANKL